MKSIRSILTALVVAACVTSLPATPARDADAQQVKKLIAVLKSDAPQKDKADACRELARIGTKEAVAPLAALLPDEKLSHMARYGLEPIPDAAVDKALRDAARKVKGTLLVGVIGSIGVRRDAKAVGLLDDLLDSSDNSVAQAAARALGSIGTKAARNALLDELDEVSAANQLAFCEGLLRCAEAAAAKGDREAALEVYERLRVIPMPQQVRAAAVRGSILYGGKDGLRLMSLALHNDDYTLAAAAVRAAQEKGCPCVTRVLVDELPSLAVDRQVLVIQTLARRADPAALPALFVAARKGELAVRLAAVRALAEIGSAAALPVLVELMGDADKDLASAAQASLASLPGAEVDAAVMKAVTAGPTDARLTAMDLVVRRRMTSAIPTLVEIAAGPDAQLRTAALKKLGELAGPAEIPQMLNLLGRAASPEDLEATEQALSAVCLKAPEPGACVAQVEARMAQAPPAQKCALVRVLGAVGGPKALQAIRGAVSDPNTEVRAAAIRVLSGWTTPDAAPDLLDLAKAASNGSDKLICLRGYLRLAGQAELPVDKRLDMCRQAAALAQKDNEKKLLLATLGGIASVEAVDLIVPSLDDSATKEEAATAAVDVADKVLKEKDAAKVASKLVEPLNKVAQATANADLAKRAKDLAAQAAAKAAAK